MVEERIEERDRETQRERDHYSLMSGTKGSGASPHSSDNK